MRRACPWAAASPCTWGSRRRIRPPTWRRSGRSYVPAAMSVVSITRSPGAPEVCNLSNDDGAAVVVGCIDISGPNPVYSGSAYDVVAECKKDGELQLNLASPDTTKTFVSAGGLNSFETVHTHGDSVICGSRRRCHHFADGYAAADPGSRPDQVRDRWRDRRRPHRHGCCRGHACRDTGLPGRGLARLPPAPRRRPLPARPPRRRSRRGRARRARVRTPSARTVAARTGTPAAGAGVPDGPETLKETAGSIGS